MITQNKQTKQAKCVLRERPHRRPRVPCDTTQGGGLVKGKETFLLNLKTIEPSCCEELTRTHTHTHTTTLHYIQWPFIFLQLRKIQKLKQNREKKIRKNILNC